MQRIRIVTSFHVSTNNTYKYTYEEVLNILYIQI
jgi:hypothetical protein